MPWTTIPYSCPHHSKYQIELQLNRTNKEVFNRTQKDSFIADRQFTEFYTSFQMNFGAYFCGVLAALVYDQLSLKQYKLRELRSFQVLWFTLIPVGIFWLFTAHPIYQHYYAETPRIWGAIYAAVQRNLWAFGLGIFVVGMAGKVGCKWNVHCEYV